jgi:hypothetical protein
MPPRGRNTRPSLSTTPWPVWQPTQPTSGGAAVSWKVSPPSWLYEQLTSVSALTQ